MNSSIRTISGRLFDVAYPRWQDVSIRDISHALARLCRFCGHLRTHYSVAQHSVLVSRHCDPADALWGLLHDAAEAYVADIPGPLKQLPLLAGYRVVERRVQDAVARKFDLPPHQPQSVLLADRRVALAEMRDLFDPPGEDGEYEGLPIEERVVPVGPEDAARLFVHRYVEIRTGCGGV